MKKETPKKQMIIPSVYMNMSNIRKADGKVAIIRLKDQSDTFCLLPEPDPKKGEFVGYGILIGNVLTLPDEICKDGGTYEFFISCGVIHM